MRNFDVCTCVLNLRRRADTCPQMCAPVGLNRSAHTQHLCGSEQAAWGRRQRGNLLAHLLLSGTVLRTALALSTCPARSATTSAHGAVWGALRAHTHPA